MDNLRNIHHIHEYYSQVLYQTGAKGELRVWKIWVTGIPGREGIGIIHREHGVRDGKMNLTSREIREGKNIGKKNETHPLNQAIAEAQSIAKKKQRSGYSPDGPISDKSDDVIILPMLAHDYHKQNKGLVFPCCAQPKLDGVRMVVERLASGELRMTTRTGKSINFMDHIASSLTVDVLPVGIVLDGELFTHEKTFEEITGIVRKSVKEHHNPEDALSVKYHVFDVYVRDNPEMSFADRFKIVENVLSIIDKKSVTAIVKVPTIIITNQVEADEAHERFVGDGHEGTIYRYPNSSYKVRLRSRDLLKRKDFVTEEYTIVGAEEADGRDKGTVIWIVETTDNVKFNVRPRGTLEQRAEWWINHESYIGKLLTVRFQNLTDGGIPRFPVGLTIRDYE